MALSFSETIVANKGDSYRNACELVECRPMENSTTAVQQFSIFLFAIASLGIPSGLFGFQHIAQRGNAALFVFGDSFSDPGNNNYINTTTYFKANFWPYGETFFHCPTGRFCDGRIIPDFIAEFANLPLIPPYLETRDHQLSYGVNFASGGAGVLVQTDAGKVIDLQKQLRYFKNVEKQLRWNLGNTEAKQLLSNAVYLFNGGGNDFASLYEPNSTILNLHSPEEYIRSMVGNFTDAIREIYKRGGRKFGFLNLAPIGCWPSTRARKGLDDGQCMDELNAMVKLYNAKLSEKFKQLEKRLNGFQYSDFDYFTAVGDMIEHPFKYGFKEVKSGCCGTGPYRGIPSCGGKGQIKEFELCDNPGEYLFFDCNHPTERANHFLAELMWQGVSNITGPHNLKSLFQLDTSRNAISRGYSEI